MIKNFHDNKLKTFLVGLIFILLLLLEPDYSEFYSVAPDKQLSTIVKTEMGKMIDKSPDISDVFDVLASEIRCSPNKSKMVPLANSDGRLDGKQLVKISAVFKSSNIGETLNGNTELTY